MAGAASVPGFRVSASRTMIRAFARIVGSSAFVYWVCPHGWAVQVLPRLFVGYWPEQLRGITDVGHVVTPPGHNAVFEEFAFFSPHLWALSVRCLANPAVSLWFPGPWHRRVFIWETPPMVYLTAEGG